MSRWLFIIVTLVSTIGCDQATKQIAQSQLKGRAMQSFYGDVLRLDYAENPGAFLGVGGQLSRPVRWILLVGVNALIATAIVGALAWRRRLPVPELLAYTLVLSGALGNLVDRVRFDGLVVDFLNLGIGPLRTGIFNVADVAISAGAVLLVVLAFRIPRQGAARVIAG